MAETDARIPGTCGAEGIDISTEKIIKVCAMFSRMEGITVSVVSADGGGEHVIYSSQGIWLWKENCDYIVDISGREGNIALDPEYGNIYYGLFRIPGKVRLVLGPMYSLPLTDMERFYFYKTRGGQSQVHMPLVPKERCRSMLELLAYIFTGRDLEFRDLTVKERRRGQKATDTEADLSEVLFQRIDRAPHHSYASEALFLRLVGSGNDELAIESMDLMDRDTIGIMGKTHQKSLEYEAVILVSLSARAAIQSGLSEITAYGLADMYLQKISEISDPKDLLRIEREAVRAFCEHIRSRENEADTSLLTTRCKGYIRRHIGRELSLETIAGYFNVSPAYLSHEFSTREKITMKQFISRERVKQAKNMLRFSDYSISQIAGYLGYSSQSYFGAVFKKETGVTPGEYRNSFVNKT